MRWLGPVLVGGLMPVLLGCGGGDDGATASTSTQVSTITTSTTIATTIATSTTVRSTTASSTTIAPVTSTTVPATSDSVTDGAGTPAGFVRVAASATTASGEVCDLCLWLAASPADRSRGLMFVTDLGAADGMAFVYEEPTTSSFWMKNTLLPLSIAFFDARGDFLDGFDMEPCDAEPCDRYPTPVGFTVAVEVLQGTSPELGLVPGSTLTLTDNVCP